MAIETIGLVAVTENAAKKVAVKAGGKIKAKAGTKYLLQVENSDVAPENVTVKRVGTDLLVQFEGSEKPDLTIQNFFEEGMDSQLYGVAEDGQLYAYVRTDGEGFYGQLLMADGESAPIALGGDALADGAPYLASTFDDAAGFVLWPWLLGLAGVGAAAAAIIHHNKDGGGHHDQATSPAPTNSVATDDVGPKQGQLHDGDLTDDAHPEISGNGVPGAIIHVIDNGKEIGSTTVQPDGTWSYTPELNDGAHEIDVTQEVPGEKPSAPIKVVDIVVDTVPPDAPAAKLDPASDSGTKGDNITNDTTPTIDGKTEPNADVTVIIPSTGEEIHTKADENGDWSVTPTQPLPDGKNDITIIATDPAGNESQPTVLPIIIDTSTPPADAWLDPASDSGTKGDGITNDTTPTIDGKTEPGADVVVTFPTGEEIHTKADDNGDWSVTPTQPLPDGKSDITIIATDPAGNQSQPTVLPIIIDTSTPPADAWLDPASDSGTKGDGITNDTTPTIDGKTEPGADVVVTFPTGEEIHTKADDNGDWSVTPTKPLPEGENDITVVATDPAGNTSEPTVLPIVIDTTAPSADAWLDPASDSGTKGDGITNDTTPTIDGKTEPGSTVVVTFPTGESVTTIADDKGDWSVTPTQPLPEGPNEITVVATDPAGNTSEPNALPITIDTTGPQPSDTQLTINTVAGDDIVNLAESKQPQIISGKAIGEFQAGDIVTFTLNNHVYTAVVAKSGEWNVQVSGADLAAETNIHAVLVAHDVAGNESNIEADHAYRVDLVAPDAPVIVSVYDDAGDKTGNLNPGDTTDDNKPKISGTAEANSIVTLHDTVNGVDVVIGTTTTNASGEWEFTPTTPLANGPHDITATATDVAGNVSEPSNDFGFIVEVGDAPNAPTIDKVVDNDDTAHLIDVPKNGYTNDTTPVISGGGAEKGDVIHVFDGGKELGSVTVISDDGTWSFEVPADKALKEGEHDFTAKAENAAGNLSDPSNLYPINIDITAPVAPHIDHVIDNEGNVRGEVANGTDTDDRKPVISGTSAEAGLTIVVYNIVSGKEVEIGRTVSDADGNWTLSSDQYKAPLSGDVKLVAEAIDPAGNESPYSNERDFTVIYISPAPPVIKEVWNDDVNPNLNVQPDGYTNDNTALIKGTAEPNVHVKVFNGDTLLGIVDADDKGQWHINLPTGSPDGDYNIYAIAVNDAGMESTKAGPYHFIVDTVAPLPLTPTQWEIIDDVGDKTGPIHSGDITDDTVPTVRNTTGETLTPGFIVTVYDGDTPIGSTTVNEDGTWSVDVPAPVGPHDFSVTVTDFAKNEGDKSNDIPFVTDVPAGDPVITGVFNDEGVTLIPVERSGHTNDATPEIHGTAKAGSLVEVYDNTNTLIGTATADNQGNWSLDASTLEEGKHDLTVRAQDPAGNWSDKVSNYTIYVDLTAPTKPTIDYADDTVGTKQGHVLDNGYTDDPNPVFHGKGEAGTIIHLYEQHDGGARSEIGSAVVNQNGDWQIKPTDAYSLIGNPETAYTFTADSYDKAGNHTSSDDFHLNVDFVAPTVPTITDVVDNDDLAHLIDVPKNGYTNDTTPVISGGGAEKGDVIHVFDGADELGSVTVTSDDGTWSFEVPPAKALEEGEHDFTAKAEDQAGNMSGPSDLYPINIDITAPAAPVIVSVYDDAGDKTGNLNPGDTTDDNQPKISGTAEANSIVTLHDTVNGVDVVIGTTTANASGNWEFTPTTPLNNGPHDITATATDAAGNVSVPSNDFGFTVDAGDRPTTPTIDDVVNNNDPAHLIDVPKDGETNDNTPVISGGGDPGDTIHVIDNGTEIGTAVVDPNGDWTFTPVTPMEDGPHDIKVIAEDPAGNKSDPSQPYPITIDTTPPVAGLEIDKVTGDDVINLVESQNPQTISGKATGEFQEGDVVSFKLNGTTYTATVASDGKWSVQVAGADLAADSKIDATLKAHDAAGNEATVKALHPYEVDLVPPVATLTIDTVAGDDMVNAEEAKQPQTISGKASGEFQEGDQVSFDLNGTHYTATVAADGTWSVQVAGADLAAGTNIHATLVAHDAAGNSSDVVADHAYTVYDREPIASLNINIIAGDDIVNLEESKVDQPITGGTTGGRAGDVVTLDVNGKTYTGTIDAQGKWSINVPGSELVADPDHRIEASFLATDIAGNSKSATATHDYSVDITPPVATLTINVVAGDDVVNLLESQSPQTISGKASGEFREGDKVKFDLNGTTYSAAVAKDGTWSVSVLGADLAKGTSIHATLEAHDTAGNVADVVADRPYTVDITPPVATLTINTVAGDDVLNYVESQTQQTISGKAGGEFRNGDVVSFTLNGHDYSAAVDASGNWSVQVQGSDLAKATSIDAILKAHDTAGNEASVTANHPYKVEITPPVAGLVINPVAGDDVVNLEESQHPQTISGKATGQFTEGDEVSFTLNGTQYTTTVAADGTWSVQVAGADLAADTKIDATLVAHDAAGNETDVEGVRAYSVDITPPVATLTINVVAGDDIVNLEESQQPQTISGKAGGEFKAGDIVTFDLNGHTYTASVASDGKWSVQVAGADLAKETNIHATLVAHDTAGNEASVTADRAYTVDTVPPVATLTINVVAGDDVVNIAESMTNQTISGKAGGEFQAGDVVTFTLNGTVYNAPVNAAGDWSVQVSGTDLAKGTSIDAKLVAHDAAGNSTEVTASHPYTVDLVAPVATLAIDKVTGDDIVNQEESKHPQTISGKVTGEFQKDDEVSFTLNGTQYIAKVAADGTWSVQVAGADLAAETNIHATLVAHDAAGNVGVVTADHGYQVIVVPGAVSLTIDVVAGDDVVNLAESKAPQIISGKVTGDFTEGDVVSFKLNTTTYTATVAKDGTWSVEVAGSDLAKETNIHATVAAHDEAGNLSNVSADHPYAVDTVPPVATLTIDKVAGDDIVNAEEAKHPQTISGKASGEFQEGDQVKFDLNGTTYSAVVKADGTWSVEVAGSDLAKATSIDATLKAHDAAGNESTATANHPYTVITDMPEASLNINIVAGDDVINLEESKVDQPITGGTTGGRAGDVVTLDVNGKTYTGTIDAQGKWSINVPGAELVADPDHRIEASFLATDIAGNSKSATAIHDYSVDTTPPVAQLTINVVAGDDVVNLAESKAPQTISGKASGEFQEGDKVKFDLNGTTYSAAVAKDGTWSVSVPGADLAKGTSIHATLEAHDTAGNVANVVADRPYTVDTTPPTPTLTIDTVAGDDVLNYVESQEMQTISGKAGGDFMPNDVVRFTLNGHAYSAAVDSSGNWSVQVPGSDLAAATVPSIIATLVAHDAAGNEASVTANHPYVVRIDPLDTTLTIDKVTDDNTINLIESQNPQTVSGKASGDFLEGDKVSFTLNGTTYSTTVGADGKWSVQVAGADLAAQTNIHAILEAHDTAGNTRNVEADHAYKVDLVPPSPTLTIDVVAGDDVVNLTESQNPQTISGKVTGEFTAGDKVSFELNHTTYTATVAADGKWSVQVAGADLAAETNIHATLKAHDTAGNEASITADHAYTVDTVPPIATLTINVVAGDDVVNIAESMTNQTISGKAGGEFQAGDVVTFTLNGTVYNAQVNAAGNWSVQVSGTDLAKGTSIDAKLVAHDAAGNSTEVTASHPYTVDLEAPKPTLTIDTVAGDDIVNLEESKQPQTISGKVTGEFQKNDEVSFTLNGTQYTAKVAADGTWSVPVAGADLAKETNIHATLVAHDAAGNVGSVTADHAYTVDTTPPDDKTTHLTINVVAGDDIVNLEESKQPQTISGKATGEFQKDDEVSFTLNGTQYTAKVAADGTWSVQVAGSDLAKETNIHATLVAHDAAGNVGSVTADHPYTVDTVPPVASLTIDKVAGDDILNLAESQQPQTISGKAGGEFQEGDLVKFDLNGTTYSAAVDKDGNWSVDVAGADLAKETNIHAVLEAHDKAGNSSTVEADHAYTVILKLPEASLNINVIAGDDIVNLEESKVDQPITGGTTGGRAGDVVTLVVNGKSFTGTIDADGKWSIKVPGSDLVADADHRIEASFLATDAAGNSKSATAIHDYGVDVTAPVAQLTINVIAGDDVVNLAESKQPQTISGKASGEFKEGDLVKFDLNGTTYSAAVAKDGSWSVLVPGADLAKGTSIHATLEAHDTAGNVASVVADRPYTVDTTPPVATLTIDTVAGDDVLNYVESQTQQTVSGKAGGEFQAGDIVSFMLNGTTYSAAVASDGKWSVQVQGSDLAKATSIDATLVAHDAAGNEAGVTASHPYEVKIEPPVAGLVINPVAGDDVVNLEESKQPQTISGKATGQFLEGDKVSFTLNGTDYSTTVAKDGTWSVSVAGSDLVKETSINAILQAHDDAGNVSEVPGSRSYGVDITPPVATLTIDTVAGDDIVNIEEAKVQQTISGKAGGEFKAGDIVSFTLNGHEYTAAVAADGKWSVQVAGADLAKATNIHATLLAHDTAGNSASVVADHAYTVDTVAPAATLTINVVAGDDVVNIAESMTNQTISGKAGGEFMAGDLVTFRLNGTDYSATVAQDGNWSVQVSGTDLAKGTSIDAKLVAHDAAGNSSTVTANHPYTVDLEAPKPTLTINTVAGDDIVNLEESQQPQTISGKVTGEFQKNDEVSFTLNGTQYTAKVAADGSWSVQVAGADLAKETNIHATLVAHDAAGNVGSVTADHGYRVDLDGPDDRTTQLTINVVAGDDIVDGSEAAGNIAISGKVTGEFTAGDVVSFKLDGTTYNATVGSDGNWSVNVPGSKLVADAAHEIDATLVAHDAAGNVGTITAEHPYQVQLNSVSITSMSKDSAIDVPHSTDFITADGTAGRGVYGTLAQELTASQKVQISVDGGSTWTDAMTNGRNWVAVDTRAHGTDWTIQARIVANGQVQSDVASQQVTYLGTQGGAPTITAIPDAVDGYTSAKAADGSDVKVSLTGTIAKAGDTLHIIWGNTTYDQVLTAADISAGSVTAKVPALVTTVQGITYNFGVTAQIITQEGQIGTKSGSFPIATKTTATYTDNFDSEIGASGSFHSNPGHFTAQGQVGVFTIGSYGGVMYIGQDGDHGIGNHSATITFDQAVQSFGYDYWGVETSISGNGARVVAYDTQGYKILDTTNYGPYGTVGHFSYTANAGTSIAKVVLYSDYNGYPIDNFTSTTVVDGSAGTVTGQKVIDHDWETYFDDSYSSPEGDVISMMVDPQTYFVQNGAHIHGGDHLDTLKLTNTNMVLDLRSLTGDNDQAKISSIEKFDLSGAHNTLKISINDVLHLGETDMFRADGKVQVMVDGGMYDKVELYGLHDHGTASGGWQNSGTTLIGGSTYNIFTYGQLDAEILVKQAVTSTIV